MNQNNFQIDYKLGTYFSIQSLGWPSNSEELSTLWLSISMESEQSQSLCREPALISTKMSWNANHFLKKQKILAKFVSKKTMRGMTSYSTLANATVLAEQSTIPAWLSGSGLRWKRMLLEGLSTTTLQNLSVRSVKANFRGLSRWRPMKERCTVRNWSLWTDLRGRISSLREPVRRRKALW